MKIHIVARDTTSTHILARLAATLLTNPAFSVGDSPDPRADANLFFPYLEWDRFRTFAATPTAAWFSHKDLDRPEKVQVWDACAQTVTLRLTSAPLYIPELDTAGPTRLVAPPLDRELFQPSTLPRVLAQQPRVVGTSGMVYPGGRKGEGFWTRLVADFPTCVFTASGSGWPIPTRQYAWAAMPEFYRSLSVYVCTSTIEGIGYGPLEALACGIPVVIPHGVGVFDDLPALENIHRYPAGDYDGLRAAVTEALARLDQGAYNPASLRGATARYTTDAWVSSHLTAFENLLYSVPVQPPQHEWIGHSGIYYVAYGDPARECARRAVQSVKRYMPAIEVAVVSDRPLDAGEDYCILHKDEDIGARSVKTRIADLAPAHWEYILYLDADTEVVADISFLFQVLADGWSAVWCTNPAQYVLATEMVRPDNQDECDETFKVMGHHEMLQLNGGVFGFRRTERTEAFMRRWHDEWCRYAKRDQAALDRVLYTEPLRVYVLGNEWNTITRYIDADRTAGILHYPMSARRWRGMINGRLDSSEAWASVHPATPQEVP